MNPRGIGSNCILNVTFGVLLAMTLVATAGAEERRNFFGDPFVAARIVREVDDVEAVFDELMVGNRGRPRYRTVDSQSQTAPPR